MALLFMLGALIAFDIAALLWGTDSRERSDHYPRMSEDSWPFSFRHEGAPGDHGFRKT